MKEIVKIYTDGACSVQKRIGGIGVLLMYKEFRKEISEGYKNTTNNRMELMAVIRGLQMLKKKGLDIEVFSDSKYVCDAVEKGWVFNWEKNGFKKKANPDLWIRFLELYREHNVKFNWVKGHADNQYNNLCDKLAVSGYKYKTLIEDLIKKQ
jgi:ribonuclease HI